MGAFQTGFTLGSRIAADALDRKEREEQRKRENQTQDLRDELTRTQIDAAREEARKKAQIAEITRGIVDTTQGIDRAGTNAALDRDFDSALAASETGVKAENAARQGVAAPVAAPAAAAAAEPTAAPPAAAGIMPPVRGGSNLANEQALTVRTSVDPLSPEYQQRLLGQTTQLAAAQGDIDRLRAIETERRTKAVDAIAARLMKDYKGTEPQVAEVLGQVNLRSGRITMSDPDKNGLRALTVVRPDGRAVGEMLSKADQAKIFAAVGIMQYDPARALKMIEEVNKDLGQAVKDENLLATQLASNANEVATASATISDRQADNARAANADARGEQEKRTRAQAAVNLYKQNNPNATQAELDAVAAGVLSAAPAGIGKDAPAVVQLAQWALQAKMPGINNMADALQWANQSREKSPKEFEQDVYTKALAASFNDTKAAERAVQEARRFFAPAAAPASAPAAPAPGTSAPAARGTGPLVFETEAEAIAAGRAGRIPANMPFTIKNGPGGRPIEGAKWAPDNNAPRAVPFPQSPQAAPAPAPAPPAPVAPPAAVPFPEPPRPAAPPQGPAPSAPGAPAAPAAPQAVPFPQAPIPPAAGVLTPAEPVPITIEPVTRPAAPPAPLVAMPAPSADLPSVTAMRDALSRLPAQPTRAGLFEASTAIERAAKAVDELQGALLRQPPNAQMKAMADAMAREVTQARERLAAASMQAAANPSPTRRANAGAAPAPAQRRAAPAPAPQGRAGANRNPAPEARDRKTQDETAAMREDLESLRKDRDERKKRADAARKGGDATSARRLDEQVQGLNQEIKDLEAEIAKKR